MTIEKAIEQIVASESFKEDAKTDNWLRVCLGRFRKGKLGIVSSLELLNKYGYKLEVKPPVKRSSR